MIEPKVLDYVLSGGAEGKAYDEIYEAVDKAVLDSGQEEVQVIYSAYDSDENDIPINNLHEVAIKGACRLRGLSGWAGDGKDYLSPILYNPTWLEVCVHANRMIETTNDTHHVFLEGFRKFRGKIYDFSMGS